MKRSPPSDFMTAEYKLIVRSAAGVKLAEVTDFRQLRVVKRVNEPGAIEFSLRQGHRAISLLEHRSQIEVMRRNTALGLPWYTLHRGLYLSEDSTYGLGGVFQATCPGHLWLLGTRHVAYYANTPGRSVFSNIAAESLMRTIVLTNCSAAFATTEAGRLRNGGIPGVTIVAPDDNGLGNIIPSFGCAFENVLETLQKIALIGGGDFDLIQVDNTTWSFEFFEGQRGVDRTASVIFSEDRGNVREVRYRLNRIHEKTVAIVGGQGVEETRNVVIRTGPDYSASNDIETFVYANNKGDDELDSSGDLALEKARAEPELEYQIIQAENSYYGRDYEVGDLATFQAGSLQFTQKIIGATVVVDRQSDRNEQIEIEVAYA